MTLATPTRSAMARAVSSLSPVSMMDWIPKRLNAAMASVLVGLTSSATAMMPMISPFLAKKRGVFP